MLAWIKIICMIEFRIIQSKIHYDLLLAMFLHEYINLCICVYGNFKNYAFEH